MQDQPTLFNEIQFFEADHTYTYHGRNLLSATRYLKRFFPEFDQRGIARRMSRKTGQSVEAIIAEWDRSGEKSRALGTAVHAHIENVLAARKPPPHSLMPSEFEQWLALWESNLRKIYQPAQVEWVIGDGAWGVAGTVDALMFNDQEKTFHLFDWKTGKFSYRTRYGEKLLGPFSRYDDSKFNRYSLQLSLYRLIIERNTNLPLGDSYIVHLTPDNVEIHPVRDDIRDDLSTYLDNRGGLAYCRWCKEAGDGNVPAWSLWTEGGQDDYICQKHYNQIIDR